MFQHLRVVCQFLFVGDSDRLEVFAPALAQQIVNGLQDLPFIQQLKHSIDR